MVMNVPRCVTLNVAHFSSVGEEQTLVAMLKN